MSKTIDTFRLGKAGECVENCLLLLVGEGLQEEELKKLRRTLGLAHKVRFLGVREDIPELLAAADIFVLPSRWEGLPMVILEAMAAGKTIVASSVGGIPEVIENEKSGLLVQPDDIEALSYALSQVMDHSFPYREKLGIAAKKRVEESFSIKASLRHLLAIYHDLL